MPNPKPLYEDLPGENGEKTSYLATGKLKGKKALITGGDSGIGASTAILFALEGADSTIVYLPEEEEDAQNTRKRVEEIGCQCHLVALDLTKKENCQKAVDVAVEKMGGIDILFNNAACKFCLPHRMLYFHKTTTNYHRIDQMMVEDISDLPEDQWEHTFNINIHSVFYMSKYALRHMKPGATIINNASINAYIGRPDLLDYTSTKGAVVSFTRGLSNQYVGKGIRVNAIAPGPGMYRQC